ncbi:unnamed protein product [Schistosoma mattheei]|uniref:2-oxoglutarate dehydrogenase E1 component/KDG C-terminal domain-containing protein n=1 Tax=Schistosoma mattheei TaxID=31246 RepID=A0A183PDL7_9TREM|nr:unnamed protein product [Schistosoma mattheei]
MLPGSEFQRYIPDSGPASQKPENVKKLIICSGKVSFIMYFTCNVMHDKMYLLPHLSYVSK